VTSGEITPASINATAGPAFFARPSLLTSTAWQPVVASIHQKKNGNGTPTAPSASSLPDLPGIKKILEPGIALSS
jgi:hypothetical protein